MQILNAPSRQEIDRAHTWLRALDIGIPSIGNLSHVSRFKSASWLVFLITSIPIHLIFNSAVFETTYEGSQWYLTLATKAFTQGAPFFPPGASLLPAGSLGIPPFTSGSTWDEGGYGEPVPLDQYWNASFAVHQKIAFAAKESHSWTFLSAAQCHSEYVSCNSRKKYGDVVLIVDSTASEVGWARSDIFTFDPATNISTLWDMHVPQNNPNSLWFSAPCNIRRRKADPSGDDCTNTCLGAMGLDAYTFPFSKKLPMTHEPWLIDFLLAMRNHDKDPFDAGLKFNDKFDSLRIDHCLAQTLQPACKVGLSNTLLLIVILSILVKAVQGGVVACKLSSTSLVTPGDAIESFILYPDPVTRGLGTLNIADGHQIEVSHNICRGSNAKNVHEPD
ncbi:hypothetical protein ANO14919_000160 [Xylariales sp. No.14919]|nr:hypothetical protein ANO14919_000160 [Xylariales sp. No.14919]